MARTREVRIVSTAKAVKWATTEYKLAQALDCSRQAINLWGEWPPKQRQKQLELMMRAYPDGPPEQEAA